MSRNRQLQVLPPLNFYSLTASMYNLVQLRFVAQFNISKKLKILLNTLILIAKYCFFSDIKLFFELYPFYNFSFLIIENLNFNEKMIINLQSAV